MPLNFCATCKRVTQKSRLLCISCELSAVVKAMWLHAIAGRTMSETAKLLDRNPNQIYRLAIKHNILFLKKDTRGRPKGPVKRQPSPYIPTIRYLSRQGNNNAQIAKAVGLTRERVRQLRKEYRIGEKYQPKED